jgi:hypothetical protein
MPVPTNYRQDILDVIVAQLTALIGVPEGVNYWLGLKTVTQDPNPMQQLSSIDTPWCLIVAQDGGGENIASNSDQDEMECLVQVYVMKDEARFPGLSAPQIAEQVAVDVEKAMDANLSRGSRVFNSTRRREFDHDLDGRWSTFLITETMNYNRRR